MWVTSSLDTALTPTSVALGNFDGVHRGHQRVVQPVLNVSGTRQPLTVSPGWEWRKSLEATTGLPSDETSEMGADGRIEPTYATVVTFNPHPQEFFSGQRRTLLTPLDEKVQRLRSLGVEQLVLLPFDRELADLSPQQFIEKILVQKLRATRVSVGEDFCFGNRRAGTSADLQAIAASYGIDVTIVPLQTCQGERISSSMIRQSLLEGDLSTANRLLGDSYQLTGRVVKGQQLGRTIGFPTANLQVPPEKFLPSQGVYCVQVFLGQQKSKADATQDNDSAFFASQRLPGVMNLGQRPTIGGKTTTIEIHLLDWSGDLYDQSLTVSLEKFLRPEQKFTSLNALKEQIAADSAAARVFLSTHS